MDYAQFVDLVRRFLIGNSPGLDHAQLTPQAGLWELGYVDSLSTVELILFVESILGREIDFVGDARTLRSIESIYGAYVRDGGAGGSPTTAPVM